VPEHVENYTWLYEGVLGKKVTIEDIILESEKVYNFQRIFNLRLGFGTREHDYPPFRAMGPVIHAEYEDRAAHYDKQIHDEIEKDPTTMSVEEKMATVRKYREDRYEQLVDAVYKRRGWTNDGVPTLETAQRLGIDFPDVVELIGKHQN
jgi:aldehyde:ferredoxin oxidoreductase